MTIEEIEREVQYKYYRKLSLNALEEVTKRRGLLNIISDEEFEQRCKKLFEERMNNKNKDIYYYFSNWAWLSEDEWDEELDSTLFQAKSDL